MNPQCPDTVNEKTCVLSGTVMTGTKKAAFFTQIDWVKAQCAVKLGFEPYPCKLNLFLIESHYGLMDKIQKTDGAAFVPPDENFCSSRVYPMRIGYPRRHYTT